MSLGLGSSSWAMSGAKPEPAPTPEPPPHDEANNYEEYFQIGRDVDSYRSDSQLQKGRAPASHKSDSCVIDDKYDTFSESVGWGVEQAFKLRDQELDYVSYSNWDPFKIYTKSKRTHVSLMSHPLCETNQSSLQRTLSKSGTAAKMPPLRTIADIQEFVSINNKLRVAALRGDNESENQLQRLWSTFMSCLSYTESLGDPDTSRSEQNARQHAPSGYSKPTGVKFYWDVNQPIESALNIGLFQFSPGAGGNIQGCIRNWNKFNQSCQIPTKASTGEMIQILGSSRQAFNAFCGSNQILNTFYTQVNTYDAYHTDTRNVNSNGSLKLPSDRCVSLHFRTGRAYNHFSPLHNGTGDNLRELMTCTMTNWKTRN